MRIAIGADGFDTPEGVIELVAAGADEFFAGYVPPQWSDRYGWEIGLNRRVFGPQCQFASISALRAVIDAAHTAGARVSVAFNAHDYHADQVPMLRRAVTDTVSAGPDALIIADAALLELLAAWDVQVPIHLSVGAGCFNGAAVRHLCGIADVRRVVLPRKMSLPEYASMIAGLADLDLEFEALVIGYRCLFNDEFCFTRHSGVTELFCNSFVPEVSAAAYPRLPGNWKDVAEAAGRDPDAQFERESDLDVFCRERGGPFRPAVSVGGTAGDGMAGAVAGALYSHCALCSIPELARAGVRVLKVPVRGTTWQRRHYLDLVRQVADRPDADPAWCRSLLGSPEFCATVGSCYYGAETGR